MEEWRKRLSSVRAPEPLQEDGEAGGELRLQGVPQVRHYLGEEEEEEGQKVEEEKEEEYE